MRKTTNTSTGCDPRGGEAPGFRSSPTLAGASKAILTPQLAFNSRPVEAPSRAHCPQQVISRVSFLALQTPASNHLLAVSTEVASRRHFSSVDKQTLGLPPKPLPLEVFLVHQWSPFPSKCSQELDRSRVLLSHTPVFNLTLPWTSPGGKCGRRCLFGLDCGHLACTDCQ